MQKVMKHSEYIESLEAQSTESLHYQLEDAKQVLAVWPEHPNFDYYQDEIHYISMELKNRRQQNAN